MNATAQTTPRNYTTMMSYILKELKASNRDDEITRTYLMEYTLESYHHAILLESPEATCSYWAKDFELYLEAVA